MALSCDTLDWPLASRPAPLVRPAAIAPPPRGKSRRAAVYSDGARFAPRRPAYRAARGGLGFVPVAVAVPAAMQGIQAAVGILTGRVRGAQKVAATQIVNEAERLMIQNLEAFRATPTAANQAAALQNFEQLWNGILESCGDPALADAGRRCISERQRGGQFDYFRRYRDPIGEPAPASGSPNGAAFLGGPPPVGSTAGLNLPPTAALLGAAALVAVFMLTK